MPDAERRCVELTAVFNDGSVVRRRNDDPRLERMTGDGIAELWDEMSDHAGEVGWPDSVECITTKPLRKTITLRGWYEPEDGAVAWDAYDGVHSQLITNAVPDSVDTSGRYDNLKYYDFRVTVEAVLV